MIVHYVSMRFLNLKWDAWFAGLVYTSYLFVMGARMTQHMGSLILKHGFLDGGVPRDNIPDARVRSTVVGLKDRLLPLFDTDPTFVVEDLHSAHVDTASLARMLPHVRPR